MSESGRKSENSSARNGERKTHGAQEFEIEGAPTSQPEIREPEHPSFCQAQGHTDRSLEEVGSESQFTSGEYPERRSSERSSTARIGKCKWFNVAKGWGFITPLDGGQDVFIHQSVIQMPGFRSLAEQEEVEFECKITERGLEATRVSALGGTDCTGSSLRPRTNKRIRRMRCYNCGKFANHIAAQCNRGPKPKRCYFCKSLDHLFAECPKRKSGTNGCKLCEEPSKPPSEQ